MFDKEAFRKGDRVQLHPATDRWMMGDRFGTIVSVGRKLLSVHMDRSGKTVKVAPDDIGNHYWQGG